MHNIVKTNSTSPQQKKTIIFGCGNIYLGDDGFGPAVVNCLMESACFSEDVEIIDAGTSIRDQLFDFLLAPALRPAHIIIVDSIDEKKRSKGEVFNIDVDSIPAKKIHDFSLHQFPTVNMLQELQEFTDVKVSIVVAQIGEAAEEVRQGLSLEMEQAVPVACKMIADLVSKTKNEVTAL